ncbi:MAG: glutamate--cysteine ligase [Betaproteobacteria bacterium]|nr:MAG: glutamate--cysteine ligase [Betaproteobacteria bacterium]TMI12326.1 MAG: glutamate--cysteine ligase [Betaproteobacteria bacterium]
MSFHEDRLRTLAPETLRGMHRGIEKESLRVRSDGALSQAPHPPALGSPLTHPHITTDFSEAQLELITGVHGSVEACLQELTWIHQFVYRHIGDEILWCASMPCNLPADNQIPIGRYGTSNVGRAKTVYRLGLALRYGRRMQAISGIHYNWSLPGVTDAQYFALIRNFRRHSWLPIYLFGASPAACSSFVEGRKHELVELSPGTMYAPHATSLRMGPLGYQSDAQSALRVSYNDLKSYAASLDDALTKPYPPYAKAGIRDNDNYRQLSTSLLQIENEFYGSIRPKRRINSGERALHALRERGVEYVEVRLMDLDPFCPIGIWPATCRFLDLFLLHCLLADSPPDTTQEIAAIRRNQQRVALRGREPGLKLQKDSDELELVRWGGQILSECAPIAEALDQANGGGSAHRDALAAALQALRTSDSVPSAKVLQAMAREHRNSFVRFALAESTLHKASLKGHELPREANERFTGLADWSLERQREIEAADKVPFEAWRQKYLSHDTLVV